MISGYIKCVLKGAEKEREKWIDTLLMSLLLQWKGVFNSNKINADERKILFRDIPSLLESLQKDADISISSSQHQLMVKTSDYKRTYFENGQVQYEEWFLRDSRHRDGDKPAVVQYFKNGQVKAEMWSLDGFERRNGGKPARIFYRPNGQIKT